MKSCFSFFLILLSTTTIRISAQEIVYADVIKSDIERMNFEILGKSADNYLVYKEVNNKHKVSVYDYNMKLVEEVPVRNLPKRDELLDIAFYSNSQHKFLLYQYQLGDIVYLKAVSIEDNGKIMADPVVLDTTMIAYKTQNKIYNSVFSNDQSKLLVFKINKKDKSLYRISTKLFNESLEQVGETEFSLPMKPREDNLSGYSITNNGDFAFIKYNRLQSGNIVEASLIENLEKGSDYSTQSLNIDNIYLDDLKLMIDDMHGRYLLSSLYSTQKRGDIDGLYVSAFDIGTRQVVFENTTVFDNDLKKRAKGKSNIKNAFDNFFINNIIVKNNGDFTVSAEAMYSSGNWDRWGMWGSPFWGSGLGYWGGWGPGWGWGWGGYWSPYSYWSPFFYRSYWWGGWGPGWYGGGNYQQFNAGNIAILSFNNKGEKMWDNVIMKSQSENNTDGSISYQVFMDGDEMHYFINNSGKISELENIIIKSDGSTLKSQSVLAHSKRLDFMPRYGKQTGKTEMIIPYYYKNNISFAKVKW